MQVTVNGFSGINVSVSGIPVINTSSSVPTGQLTGAFYPLNSNPAGYVTSSAGGTALQITGSFPFATGLNISGFSGTSVILSGNYLLIGGGQGAAVGGSGTNIQITGSNNLSTANFSGISGILISYSGNNFVILNTNQLQNQINTIVNSGTNLVLTSQTGNFVNLFSNQTISGVKKFANIVYSDIITGYTNLGGISLLNYQIYDQSNNLSFDWKNRYFEDGAGNISLSYTNRILYDNLLNPVLNWQGEYMSDSSQITSLNWNSRYLYDSNALQSLDWKNRFLINTGGTGILNWQTQVLSGNWNIGTGTLSVQGNSVVTNNQTGNFITNGQTGIFATAANLGTTGIYLFGLINASSAGVSSLNSLSGALTLSQAGNIVITSNGQTITVSGNTGAYSNFVNVGQTGNFVTSSQTGQFIDTSKTGNFVTTGTVNIFATLNGTNTFSNNNTFQKGVVLISNPNATFIVNAPMYISGAGYLEFNNLTNSQMLDNSGNYTIDPNYRILFSTGNLGATSVDWQNKILYNIAPNQINTTGVLNWQTQTFSGNWNVGTGTLSVQGNPVVTSNQTGNFISNGQTGIFATSSNLGSTGIYLYGLINASSAGVSSINSLSGSLTLSQAGNVVITSVGQTITISGNTGAYSNFVNIGQTGQFIDTSKTGNYTSVGVGGGATLSSINITGVSGVSIYSSGNVLYFSGQNTGLLTNQFYPLNSNPSSYITSSQTGGFIDSAKSGLLVNAFYPLVGNPSNFTLNSQTGNFITNGQTGIFVTTSQTGGFGGGSTPTGQLTGAFYPLTNNPSGFFINSGILSSSSISNNIKTLTGNYILTNLDSTVLLSGNNIIATLPSAITSSGLNYDIKLVYGSATLSGIQNIDNNNIYTSFNVNKSVQIQSDGNQWWILNSLLTGILTGSFYPLGSNPSGYLSSYSQSGAYLFNTIASSGVNLQFISFPTNLGNNPYVIPSLNNPSGSEHIIVQSSGIVSSGYWAQYSNTIDNSGYVLTTLASLSTSSGLATTVIIQNLTGNYYPLNSNPSNYITSSQTGTLASYSTTYSKSITIPTPTTSDIFTMFNVYQNIVVKQITSILVGTSNSTANCDILFSSGRNLPGVEVIAGGFLVNSSGTGNSFTNLTNSVISGGDWVWISVTGLNGTVSEIHTTLFYNNQ